MKVFLLDDNGEKVKYLRFFFQFEADVEVVHDDFRSFMSRNRVDCVVSPANSFGIMDGGYDRAIKEWFGEQLPRRVQEYIREHYFGEQPVGASFIIDAGRDGQRLIHTPTMRIPRRIKDPLVVYQCMRTTLMTVLENGVESIVIPVFGGATGGIPPRDAAELMYDGYRSIMSPPERMDWQYAVGSHPALCRDSD